MMIVNQAIGLFFGHGIKFGMAAAAIVALLMWDRGRINAAESRGGQKTERKIGKANDKAIGASNRARNKSSTPSVRGQRDPNSVDG